jgi:hypothetical protein
VSKNDAKGVVRFLYLLPHIFPYLLPQNHYGIGNGNLSTIMMQSLDIFKTIAFIFSFYMLLERVCYAYLMSEKEVLDINGKLLNLHAFVSSFLLLIPCRTIASSSSPKSKPDPSFL